LIRQTKPMIVSMGDVAASGGYYIAAAADSIFAQPTTLTGSIGVFGTIPNMQKLWNQHLGVTFDHVKTGKFSNFLSGNFDRPMTPEERQLMQMDVNRIYDTFVKRVADGRSMSPESVDSVGQGRVWTGEQAIEIGLVDRLGNLEDAITAAAKMANLESYQLVKYPAIKDPFAGFLGTSASQAKSWFGKAEFGNFYKQYEAIKKAATHSGNLAIMPYDVYIY
jgi:protease-4